MLVKLYKDTNLIYQYCAIFNFTITLKYVHSIDIFFFILKYMYYLLDYFTILPLDFTNS